MTGQRKKSIERPSHLVKKCEWQKIWMDADGRPPCSHQRHRVLFVSQRCPTREGRRILFPVDCDVSPPPPIPNTQTHTQEKPHERMGKEFKSRSIRGKKQNHTEKRNHALENSRTFEYRRNWSHALCWFAIECSHRCECEVESSRLHGNNHTHKTQHKQHDTKDHRPWCPSRVSNWTPLLQSV